MRRSAAPPRTAEISGVTDYKVKDDAEALQRIRELVSHFRPNPPALFARDTPRAPAFSPDELTAVVPTTGTVPYDVREVIARLVDADSWTEYKADYGQTILCGYARLDGWSVGIVANQRSVVKARRSEGQELQAGGVIYSDSADKAARFILNCNQKGVPLIFLQDVTGFMVGKRAEHGGIIKDGAKMVNAVANSVVPKFTVVIGNSYGAGNYAMCGRAYDPRLMLAWPTARIAVMGGAQAAKTLLQIEQAKLKKQGKEISPEEEAAHARRHPGPLRPRHDALLRRRAPVGGRDHRPAKTPAPGSRSASKWPPSTRTCPASTPA